MNFELTGRTAVVTGGANGIGLATAHMLASEGATVILVDIDREKAAAAADALKLQGLRAEPYAADVTDEASIAILAEDVTRNFGGADILVNNAGFTRDMRITKMPLADWDAVVDVILKGAFLCSRALLPAMVERRWGRIISISSRAHLGNPGQANYSAAKAGLIGFTRALALEYGRFNITVNAVAPGLIDTPALRNLAHFESVATNAAKTTPIPRLGQPEDVASAVTFLSSGLAGYVTGEVLHVTGGRY